MNETAEEISKEYLKTEYQEVRSLLVFFAGVRFAFLASFGTLSGVLLGSYGFVWRSRPAFLDVWEWLLFLFAVLGLLVAASAWLIEKRTVVLYQTCLRRGLELEIKMGITTEREDTCGIYSLLIESYRAVQIMRIIFVTHTFAIRSLYFMIGLIWLALTSYGAYLVLHK